MIINNKKCYKIKSETSRNFKVSKQNTTCYKLLTQAQLVLRKLLWYSIPPGVFSRLYCQYETHDGSVEVLVQLRNRDLCCDRYIVRFYPLNIVTTRKKKLSLLRKSLGLMPWADRSSGAGMWVSDAAR